MRRAAAVALVLLVSALVAASPAFGLFSATATSATGTFSTAQLAPATGTTVAWTCPVKKADYTATITWTASTSAFVSGYEVAMAPTASGPWTVIANTTTTTAVETGVAHKTDRWYAVTALAYGWRSTPDIVATSAPNPQC